MAVPMLDLAAQYRRIKPEIDAAVSEVFETQMFIGGPKVQGLEQAVAAYFGLGHAVGVASGTDALLLLLRAYGIKAGDEVITTPFTFFATAGAISLMGATPVFVDIDPDTYALDPAQLEAAITPKTRAIVPVHLYGQCADMDAINAVAKKHGLAVIEDAAQAFGAKYKGRPACTLGDAAAISFYPTKNLGGAGEGGMIVTRDPAVARMVRMLRHQGQEATYYHEIVGTNSRLDALQAAILAVKLKYIDEWNAARRERAAYYTEQLREIPEIVVPYEADGNYHVYHQYVIRIPNRDQACELLRSKGIGCAVFYPIPLHRQKCFEALGYGPDALPVASQVAQEVLALPMFPELTPEQQDEVIAALKEHLARQ